MAKKKPPEEHENLERWLVSYGDFITLLFATFVVLYALAQTDVNDFAKLEEALKNAFSQQTLLNGQEGIMNNTSDSIFELIYLILYFFKRFFLIFWTYKFNH